MTVQAILPEAAGGIFGSLAPRPSGLRRDGRRQRWRRSVRRHEVRPVPAIPRAIAILDHDRPVGELGRIRRIAELRFDQNRALGNIDLTIARDQPVPQRGRIVDLNIRVNSVRGADLRIMLPGLVAMIVQKRLQVVQEMWRKWPARAASGDRLREH